MARKSKSKDEQLILSNYKKEEEKLLAKNKKTKEKSNKETKESSKKNSKKDNKKNEELNVKNIEEDDMIEGDVEEDDNNNYYYDNDIENDEYEGIEIYDEKVTDVRKTNDYDKFTNIVGNRDLRGTNYNRLIQSMKKKQLVIPILVNSQFEIIDGQHRFEVCRTLELPLYYYVIDGYGIDEVKRANLVGCNWVIDDYLKLNVEIDKKEYIEFKRIKDTYGLTTSQLLDIFAHYQGISLKEVRMLFEDGSFELDSINKVIEFLNKLEDFNCFDEYNSYSFTKAFLKLNAVEGYDHSIMQKRIKKHPYKLAKRASYRDYITLLVEMYNFGTTKTRIGYDAIGDEFYQSSSR